MPSAVPPILTRETADISEAERRRAYLASAEYQQRRQKLVEWEQRQRAQAAYERYRQGERAEPQQLLTSSQNSLSKVLDTAVGLLNSAVSNIRDLSTRLNIVTSATTMFNSFRYLLNPCIDPNPTWADILAEQFAREIERGLVTNPDDVWRSFEEIARTCRRGAVNYTTLADFVESTKAFVPSAAGLGSFGLSAYGVITDNKDVQAAGDVTGGAVGILQGIQTFGNQTLIARTTATLLGKTSTVGLGLLGFAQLLTSGWRLIDDPSLNPVANGQWNNTTWIERVGVATTGIGGAFLAAGAFAAFIPGGQAVAAVLLPAGLAFVGAGAIMQNWGTVQQWVEVNNVISLPSVPQGVQTVPAPTAPPSPLSTPAATSTPAPPDVLSQSTPAVSPALEAPSPNPSHVPAETPHP